MFLIIESRSFEALISSRSLSCHWGAFYSLRRELAFAPHSRAARTEEPRLLRHAMVAQVFRLWGVSEEHSRLRVNTATDGVERSNYQALPATALLKSRRSWSFAVVFTFIWVSARSGNLIPVVPLTVSCFPKGISGFPRYRTLSRLPLRRLDAIRALALSPSAL